MRIMEILADATNVIAEGEVLQLMNMHDAALDEAGYLRVIRSKTAKLFEASARLGAVLAGAEPAAGAGLRRLRPGARHGVPGDRRRARLRRRRRRDGQEPRRRPARRQGHLAADRGDAARHARRSATSFATPSKPAASANWITSSRSCGRPGALEVTRAAAAAEARARDGGRAPTSRQCLQPGFATIGGSTAAAPQLTARNGDDAAANGV